MDYAPLIEKRRERLAELEVQIADPELFQDRQRAGELMREHRRTQELLRDWAALQECLQQIEENRELASGDDPEMAELAAAELEELEPRVEKLTELSRIHHRRFCEKYLGQRRDVLFETSHGADQMVGYTDNYIRVEAPYRAELLNRIAPVTLLRVIDDEFVEAEL